MLKTREVLTEVTPTLRLLEQLRGRYEKKLTVKLPIDEQIRLYNAIGYLKLAAEAVEVFNPIELNNGTCQTCGRYFTPEERDEQTFYYCPNCGQALIDWLDPEIVNYAEAEE